MLVFKRQSQSLEEEEEACGCCCKSCTSFVPNGRCRLCLQWSQWQDAHEGVRYFRLSHCQGSGCWQRADHILVWTFVRRTVHLSVTGVITALADSELTRYTSSHGNSMQWRARSLNEHCATTLWTGLWRVSYSLWAVMLFKIPFIYKNVCFLWHIDIGDRYRRQT